ncbi:hypothetical protein N7497_005330 [Penicillium chrysogenum]|nr:hypothetical protein N7497_005330 [Penicillium chrysogenum]
MSKATFFTIGNTASQHLSINFIAISHSGHASTEKLLEAISGPGDTSLGSVARENYAKGSLGVVSWGHVLSPAGLLGGLEDREGEGYLE